MDCPFCAICAGTEPAEVVDETATTLAFAPLDPVAEGHVLVIPKAHHETLFDVPASTLCRVVEHAKSIAERLTAHDFDGVTLLNDSSHQQTVPHFHLHLAPRRDDDGLDLWPESDYEESDVGQTYDGIRRQLGFNGRG